MTEKLAKEQVTLTAERIAEYAFDKRMCNVNEEVREMAKMLLASFHANPVYQLVAGGNFYNVPKWKYDEAKARGEVCQVLYDAPPAFDLHLYPEEATAEMQTAGATAIRIDTTPLNKLFTANAVYAAMRSAAPPLRDFPAYFAYSPDNGFKLFKTQQEAVSEADSEIESFRDVIEDGWDEEVREVVWGVIVQQAQGYDAQGKHTSDPAHTYQTCNYRLSPSLTGRSE